MATREPFSEPLEAQIEPGNRVPHPSHRDGWDMGPGELGLLGGHLSGAVSRGARTFPPIAMRWMGHPM